MSDKHMMIARARHARRKRRTAVVHLLLRAAMVAALLLAPAFHDMQQVSAQATAPAVSAGGDQRVNEESTVTLNGAITGSGALSYEWAQIVSADAQAALVVGGLSLTNSTGTLTESGAASSTFTAPAQTTSTAYYFRLTGTAGSGTPEALSSSDIVVVTVTDIQPPTVGSAITIDPAPVATGEPENTTATVSVTTASDPDGDTVTRQWTQVSPPTPAIVFGAPNALSTMLTYPELSTPRDTQEFTIRFTVSDSVGLSASTDISVTVHDTTAPTANAGADFRVNTGTGVTLDAGASRNAAGNEGGITYAWTQVTAENSETAPGSPLSLATPNAVTASFTAPAMPSTLHFWLSVSDDVTLGSHSDWITVRVTNPPRTIVAPAVTATDSLQQVTDEVVTGANFQTNPAATSVTLRGIVTRGDGDDPANTLSYEWVQVAGAALDAVEVAPGEANYTTLTNASGTPGTNGVSEATFSAPRVTDRISGNPENYYFRLTGASAETGVDMAEASTVVTVSVYAPRGVVATGGFPTLVVPESIGVITVTFTRRHDWRQANGNILFRGSIGGNTNNGAVNSASVRPDNSLRNVRDFFVNERETFPGSHTFEMGAFDDTLTWQYTVRQDDNAEELEGVGFGYNFECIVCSANNYVLEPRLGIAHGFINDAVIQDDDTVTVGWSTSTFTVNENAGNAELTVTIESPAIVERNDFPLQYATISGGSAVAGTDYTAVAATDTTLDVSARTATVMVPITDNNIIETVGTVRTFLVQLSTATSTPLLTAIGRATATVTIVNDDFPEAVLSITPNRTSFNEGDTDAHFDIALTGGPFSTAVTVDFAVTGTGITTGDYDITAPAGIDAAASAGTLTFNTDATDTAANPQSDRVTLSIADENFAEAAETLVFDVRTSIGAASQTSVTIAASDPLDIFLIGVSDTAEGGTHTFTVNMEAGGVPPGDLRVAYTLGAGGRLDRTNAVVSGAGADLTDPNSGAVTIPAGSQSGEIMLFIIDDNLNEGIEQYRVTITANDVAADYGTPTITSGEAEGVILASDPITVSIARDADTAASINEGESAEFTVTLSGASSGSAADITVPYSLETFSGEASDTGGGMLTINAGDTEGTITINTSNSATLNTGMETLTVTLGASPAAGTGGGSVSRTADTAGQSAQVTVNFVEETHALALEGANSIDEADMATSAIYTVRRIGPAVQSGQDLVITWAAVADTAVAADFDSGSLPGGTLTFSGSAETATFRIDIEGDNINEPAETFDIGFSIAAANQGAATANGGVAVPSTRSVTINDDDAITVTIANAGAVNEGDMASFPVTLSGGESTIPVRLPYTLPDAGSAGVAGSGDVNSVGSLAQTLEIPAGDTTGAITVGITDDRFNESTETLTLAIGTPQTAGEISANPATVSAEIAQSDDIGVWVDCFPNGSTVTEGVPGSFANGECRFGILGNSRRAGEIQVEWVATIVAQTNLDTLPQSSTRVNADEEGARDLGVRRRSGGAFMVDATAAGTVTGTLVSFPGNTNVDHIGDIFIDALQDAREEGQETVRVTITRILQTYAGAGRVFVGSPSSDTFDIAANLAAERFVSFGAATMDGAEGGDVTIPVRLTGVAPESGQPVTVDLTATGGGANPAESADYTLSPSSLTFTGLGEQNVVLTITDDNRNESTESVIVSLSNPQGGGGAGAAMQAPNSVTVSIAQNDPITYSITAAPNPAPEDGEITFTVGLSAQSEGDVSVALSPTAGGSFGGRPGLLSGEYSGFAASMMVTVPAGASSTEFRVNLIDDSLVEVDESFSLLPGAVTRAAEAGEVTAAGNPPIVRITDNDNAWYAIAAVETTVAEGGDAQFNINLVRQSDDGAVTAPGDVVVPWSASVSQANSGDANTQAAPDLTGGTGAAGATLSGEATIAAGQSMATITLSINSDQLAEDEETLTVTMGTPPTLTAETGVVQRSPTADSAQVTIPENTAASQILSVSRISGSGPLQESGAGADLYRLTLDIPDGSTAAEAITVNWRLDTASVGADANPAEAADFTTSTGVVTIAAGAETGTTATVSLQLVDDTLNEGAEEFSLLWELAQANPDVALPPRLDATIAADSSDTIALTRAAVDAVCVEATNGCFAPDLAGPAGIVATEDIRLSIALEESGGVGGVGSWIFQQPSDSQGEVEQRGDEATARFASTNYNADERLFIQVGQESDSFNEDTQTLVIRFTGGESAGDVSVDGIELIRFTVTADDPTTVTVSDAPAATEGDSAMFPVEFIGGIPTRDVEIDWEVVLTGATAEAEDFERMTGTETIRIAFPTGLSDAVTTGVVRVPLAMDDDDEEDRFIVRLTAARGAGGSGISVASASTATAVINRLDLSPPRFADPDEQPGWTAGQQVLWVKMNEDFKVLPAATGAMASTTTVSLTTLNAGDFTVTDNFGNASSAVIAVTGVTPFPDETDPALRLALASAIAADGASVLVSYEHSGGNAIYDLALERGLAGPEGRNRTMQTSVMLNARDTDTTADADDDGIPDAAEARISGDAGNPFVDVTDAQQPVLSIRRTASRNPVAYSGIRAHGVRAHLGVFSIPALSTQMAAQTMTAYYRSDTFGYDGAYQCAGSSPFPANYAAPLAEGGCAPVDWGNIAPSTNHTIAWLARSADGVWNVDTNTDSNLPEQVIWRIPELNMGAQRQFTTGAAVVRASLDGAPAETPLTLSLTRTPVGGTATTITTNGGRMFAVTRTVASSEEWEITGLTNAGGLPHLYRATPRPTTATASFMGNVPLADEYSLGLVRQTRVTRVNAPVPPVLGREFLQESVFQQQGIALVDGNSADYNLEIAVENLADIGDGDPSVTATELNGALTVTGVNLPSQLGGFNAFRVNLRMNSGLLAAGTNTAVIQVEVTGGFGGVTTATYRFPVVAASAPLAQRRRDGDFDGIADDFDDFENSDHLPVVVDEEAGASAWHHIRPALPLHDLRLGEMTARRLAMATAADQVDDYAEYSASETPPTTSNLAVVYDFEISGVDYAEVTEEGRAGGAAGVIIPLPRSLYAGGASLVKYPSNEAFSVEGGNDYGFAALQEDGACPDDTMEAGSPYREGETLRRAKRGGDACLVVYLVDGGPNDEDGVANGIIKDPLGVRAGNAAIGGGSRSHSGVFGPVALAALLLLLALAHWLKSLRRAPARRRAHPAAISAPQRRRA